MACSFFFIKSKFWQLISWKNPLCRFQMRFFRLKFGEKFPKKNKFTDCTWVSITSATQTYLSMILHMPECRKIWNPLGYIEISRPCSTLSAQRYQGLRYLEIWGPSRTFWIPFFGETHGQNASHKQNRKKIYQGSREGSHHSTPIGIGTWIPWWFLSWATTPLQSACIKVSLELQAS
jgi:hypothetical protein